MLIVDDNWNNRAVLVDLLTRLSFQTVEAENGRTAISPLRERSFKMNKIRALLEEYLQKGTTTHARRR